MYFGTAVMRHNPLPEGAGYSARTDHSPRFLASECRKTSRMVTSARKPRRKQNQGVNTMSRVYLAGMAAALITGLTLPAAQAQQPAQPQRPQIETKKVDDTDNVYIFRNGNHQAMFIVTNDGVIATD